MFGIWVECCDISCRLSDSLLWLVSLSLMFGSSVLILSVLICLLVVCSFMLLSDRLCILNRKFLLFGSLLWYRNGLMIGVLMWKYLWCWM